MSTELITYKLKTGTEAERQASTTIETREAHITSDKRELFVGATPVMRAIADGAAAKHGVYSIPSGSEGETINFTTAFGAVPLHVSLILVAPSGSPGMSYWLVGLPTASGFTFALGLPTGNGNYKLIWSALL